MARDVRLTRLEIRGERLELGRPDGTGPDWVVVVGRNGSGKSALLDAIAFGERAGGGAGGPASAPGFVYYTDHAPAALPADFERTDLPEGFLAGLDPAEDLRVAGLVLDILDHLREQGEDADSAALVLLDEIEAGLHVSRQRRIRALLTSRFPAAQFVVTTHSPYVCQTADPGALIRLPGPREDRPVELVDEELCRRAVYGSADDAALSDLFGLESAYSEEAERLRAELVALERRIVRGEAGAAEEHRHRELSILLTSSTAARADEIVRRRDEP